MTQNSTHMAFGSDRRVVPIVSAPMQLLRGTLLASLPGGSTFAVISGDPARVGLFMIRVELPSG